MRVTVDCFAFQTDSHYRGIGSYSRDLLITLLQSSSLLEVTLLANSRRDYSKLEDLCQEEFLAKKISIRLWDHGMDSSKIFNDYDSYSRAQEIYRQVVNSTRPDKYLQLSPFELENPWAVPIGIYSIAVFYDAIPAIYSGRYLENSITKKLYFETVNKLHRIDELLCISNSSKVDASAVLMLEKPKKTLVNFGLQSAFRENPYAGIAKDPNLAFAVLGADERKNQKNLLRAWALCCEVHPELQLAIAYAHGEAQKIVNESILKELKLENNVKFLGFISEDEILKYYATAAVNIFPSYYEGLGLPVLEAYAAGTATLVANRSSLPELCEDPRLQFDPDDVVEISSKILNFLRDKTIEKNALEMGSKLLTKFTPELQRQQMRKIFTKQKKVHQYGTPKKNILEKIIICSPLIPEATGIAEFFNPVIHALHLRKELIFVRAQIDLGYYQCPECAINIPVVSKVDIHRIEKENSVFLYNIGNSSFHSWQVNIIQEFPGVVILHDVFLSGLMREIENAEKPEGQFEHVALRDHSSLAGVSKVFKNNPRDFIDQKKLNRVIIENATSIMVHNDKAKELILQDFAVFDDSAICITSLPIDPKTISFAQNSESNSICVFGRIANTKMFKEIIEAWKISATGKSGKYQLVFVGEVFSSDFRTAFQEIPKDYQISYVEEFNTGAYEEALKYAIVAIQLRRGERGESSGAIIDVIKNAIPLITNDRNLIHDIPESLFELVPKNFSLDQLSYSIDFVVKNLSEFRLKAAAATSRLEKTANADKYAESIIKCAGDSLYHQNFLPISIAKSLSESGFLGSMQEINATLDACIKSFPNVFSLRRLIIVLNLDTLQLQGDIPEDVTSAIEKFVNFYNFPIFLVVKDRVANNFLTVNNLMLSRDMIAQFNLEEFVIKIRPIDLVLSKDVDQRHSLISETEWNNLKKPLSHYLGVTKMST